jgi:O-antigen biosynthesis protein
MKLSVIIVSYNVRNFLEECLYSVIRAASGIETEVFVVDNNSSDGSAEMVTRSFPEITLIANTTNPGFSRANNQAITHAKGEYILFLNPDTLVREETFRVCMDFMESHPGAGAMGVKMINGKERYLPESKRAVPSPLVAFYKISGLTAIFPRSKRFGRYYLGHLDKDSTHRIEVLTGAFFFTRREVLDRSGWFDEDFFMYGEDIDLSCRILRNGYSIWYHPATSIIHYKGESTRKSTINYVLIFYRAMIIYTKKYYSSPGASMLLFILHSAIWFRASLSIFKRVFAGIFYFIFPRFRGNRR